MSIDVPDKALQLRSLVRADQVLELFLDTVDVPSPGPGEVVIRIEASPINPSDLGMLLAGADMSAAVTAGTSDRPVVTAPIPDAAMLAVAGRIDTPMAVGNEGAGTVVAAGPSASAQALLGRTVAVAGGGMYSQYRRVDSSLCLELPEGTTAAEGASAFVNPLTALGMVETMRLENHVALVHTAAASNLGQMLNRLCLEEQVPLVNIVRKGEQENILRAAGAANVCNSTSPTFMTELTDALRSTSATLAFDAVGGGKLASQILTCHGSSRQRGHGGLQPLRIVNSQTGLHLRRAGSRTHTPHPQLRHGLGCRRMASHPVPATDRLREHEPPATPSRGQPENHLRQQLHRRGVALRGPPT